MLDLAVDAGDDVGRHQAVADPLAGVGARAHRRVHRARLAAHQHGHVAAADELAPDEAHLRRLGHRVRGLDRRHKATGLDHTQRDAANAISHL